MSYDRFGGGRSTQRTLRGRGMRSDSRSSFSSRRSAVSPWQSGQAPGGMRSGAGLLPTPSEHRVSSSHSSSSLDTEAQLVLANNLITALLQNQAQAQTPTFSSRMDDSSIYRSGSSRSSSLLGPPPSKFGRDSFGGKFSSGFGSRDRRDYEWQRDRRTNQGPRGRPLSSFRNKQVGQQRTPRKTDSSTKQNKKEDESASSEKKKEKATTDAKASGDESKDDKAEGKGDGDDKNEEKGEEKESERRPPREYIPPDYLHCILCGVYKMQKESSFVEHVKGRKHLVLMELLEEKMDLQLKLIRHEILIAQKKADMEAWRKRQKTGEVEPRRQNHCTMCHTRFVGDINEHRSQDPLHNKLRKFLHPRCCNHSFESPIQYERHILTLHHIRRMWFKERSWKEKEEQGAGIPASCFPLPHEIEINAEPPSASDKKEKTDKEAEEQEGDAENEEQVPAKEVKDTEDVNEEPQEVAAEVKEEKMETEEEETEKVEGKKEGIVKPPPIKRDETEDSDLEYIPTSYDHEICVGEHVLEPTAGYFCPLCYKVVPEDADARDRHCRTRMHFDRYVLLKSKLKKEKVEREAAATADVEEEGKKEEPEQSQDEKKPKENNAVNEDNDGNWKRAGRKRKVAREAEGDDDEWEEHVIDEVMDEAELDKNQGAAPDEDGEEATEAEEDSLIEDTMASSIDATGLSVDAADVSAVSQNAMDLDALLESAKNEKLPGQENGHDSEPEAADEELEQEVEVVTTKAGTKARRGGRATARRSRARRN